MGGDFRSSGIRQTEVSLPSLCPPAPASGVRSGGGGEAGAGADSASERNEAPTTGQVGPDCCRTNQGLTQEGSRRVLIKHVETVIRGFTYATPLVAPSMCGSDPAWLWLWLWCRPAATVPIGPLAWEPPHAMGVALEKTKKFLNKF